MKLETLDTSVECLYLDSNSIIYDTIYRMQSDETCIKPLSHDAIYRAVCMKIDEYIMAVHPTEEVWIAFDGVAPVAKLEQQRERRYKSAVQARIQQSFTKTTTTTTTTEAWNTAAITPGTPFMKGLNVFVRDYYATNSKVKVTVSGSDEPGEGEHKLFARMRGRPATEGVVIYGLDADLIMLSLLGLSSCPKLYLFRETPHFIFKDLEPNANYLLDISLLAKCIRETSSLCPEDYIVVCFFLGNDFLPHFPAANIRTGGIDKLLEAAQGIRSLTEGGGDNGCSIDWSGITALVHVMSINEEYYFQQEHILRDKRGRRPRDPEKAFELLPSYEREKEKTIQPFRTGWRERYYATLFAPGTQVEEVCRNYVEGLEWVYAYYTKGCIDWRWKYNYAYPPLFGDLYEYLIKTTKKPTFQSQGEAIPDIVQLLYVLPKASMVSFLPPSLVQPLLSAHPEWYLDGGSGSPNKPNDEFVWAYCKYFWESHVLLPEIPLNELIQYVVKNGV